MVAQFKTEYWLNSSGQVAQSGADYSKMTGKIGIELHTGEQHGPNIIPRPWVENLIQKDIPEGTIVETNTYYEGMGKFLTILLLNPHMSNKNMVGRAADQARLLCH